MRAQIKFFETIAVLVVFFFLLMTGIAFYFGMQKSSIEKEQVRATEISGLQTAVRVLNLPDLDCSVLGARNENCIDKIKLNILSNMLKDESLMVDYFWGFGFSRISVRQAWPCPDSYCSELVLYDNPPLDAQGNVSWSHATTTVTPILLLDPWRDENAFGIIEVAVYAP
ncbi:hypothetical protein KY329_05210 [Candidatus Woesearchaeota archaeon]|nr:hypothetical protein [Candidatus Woesearchaeota archaeon]